MLRAALALWNQQTPPAQQLSALAQRLRCRHHPWELGPKAVFRTPQMLHAKNRSSLEKAPAVK